MTTENGLIITPVTGGETRSYVTNPNEWMGNVHAETDPVTGGITEFTSGGTTVAVVPIVVQWDGVDDTDAIDVAIDAAGEYGAIAFKPGKTYLTRGGHELLNGQKVFGNGATVKKMPQVTSVLNTGVTYSAAARTVDVATPSNFAVGMWVTVTSPLSALTAESTYYTDATAYKQTKPARIVSVVGNTVTTDRKMDIISGGSFTLSQANGALLAENGPIFFAGKNWSDVGSYTWATLPSNIQVFDLILDGDRLNNTEGAWWNVAPAMEFYSHYLTVDRVTVRNGASEGIVFSGKSPRISRSVFNTLDGNATHPSSYDGSNGVEDMLVSGCSARDVLKTYKRGHGDGAFGFSNNSYDAKYVNCHVDTCNGHAFGSQFNSTDARFVLQGCTAKSTSGGVRLYDGQYVSIDSCTFNSCRDETVSALPNAGKPCSVIRNSANVSVSNCQFIDSPLLISGSMSFLSITGNSFSGASLGTPAGGGWSWLVMVSGDGTKSSISHVGNVYYGPASSAIGCFLAGAPVERFASSGNVYYRGNMGISIQGASKACRIDGDVSVDAYSAGVEIRPDAAGGANIYCSATAHLSSSATAGATWLGIKVNNSSGTSADITVQGCNVKSLRSGNTAIGINSQGASVALTIIGNRVRVTNAGDECIQANTSLDTTSIVAGNILSKAFTSGVGTAVVTGLTGNVVI